MRGDARVDHRHRHALLAHGADQVGPHLVLDQQQRARPEQAQDAAADRRHIEREIDQRDVGRELLLRDGVAGGGRGTDEEAQRRLRRAQFLDQPQRDADLADADGVEPDAPALGEARAQVRRVAAEALEKMPRIAAAPRHAPEKARQQQRKADGKAKIINPPDHASEAAHGARRKTFDGRGGICRDKSWPGFRRRNASGR